MNDNTNWTPFAEDNLLGFTDKNLINEYEARGITKAELYIFGLEADIKISASLILYIHKIAFQELYEWAGRWRDVNVSVGLLTPPNPAMIIHLMYQFIDNLNQKVLVSGKQEDVIETLAYAHYEFVKIHPFNNGNGRTGRLLMNIVAMTLGYKPLELYKREGENRKIYIQAMQQADKGNFELLGNLVRQELEAF